MASSAARLFVGKLAEDTRQEDIETAFSKYGKVTRVDMKGSFAFVFYEEVSSVNDAVAGMNGYEINGSKIVCNFARNSRDSTGGGPGSKPKSENRINITGIDPGTSWQDLKDWARAAGNVSFANVFSRDGEKMGVVEYETAADLDNALRILEDTPLRGGKSHRVQRENPSHRDEGRGYSYSSRSDHDRGGYSDSRGDSRSYYDDRRPSGYSRAAPDGYDSRAPPAYSRGYSDDRRAPAADPYYRDRAPAHAGRSRSRERSRDRGYPPSSSYDRPPADYRAPASSAGYYPPPASSSRGGYADSRDYDRRGDPRGRDEGLSRGGGGGRGGGDYDSRGGYDAPPRGGGYDRGAPPAYDAPPRRTYDRR